MRHFTAALPALTTLAVACAALATPRSGRAQTTIDFAANACTGEDGGNTGSGFNQYASPFDVLGFRFRSDLGGAFGTPCAGASSYAGATALFDNTNGGTTFLTRISGAPFSINSIDLAALFGDAAPQEVTFIGTRAGGGVVTQTFTIPASPSYPASGSAFTSFAFTAAFTDLAQLAFPMQNAPFFQFTNVRLDQPSTVPEPTTWTLLGAGLVGLGIATVRRRRP